MGRGSRDRGFKKFAATKTEKYDSAFMRPVNRNPPLAQDQHRRHGILGNYLRLAGLAAIGSFIGSQLHRLTFGEIGLPVLHVGMAAATMVGGYMQRMRFGWNVGYAAGLAAGAAYAGSAVAVASGYRDQGYGTALATSVGYTLPQLARVWRTRGRQGAIMAGIGTLASAATAIQYTTSELVTPPEIVTEHP